jgi:hypothetical protein
LKKKIKNIDAYEIEKTRKRKRRTGNKTGTGAVRGTKWLQKHRTWTGK